MTKLFLVAAVLGLGVAHAGAPLGRPAGLVIINGDVNPKVHGGVIRVGASGPRIHGVVISNGDVNPKVWVR